MGLTGPDGEVVDLLDGVEVSLIEVYFLDCGVGLENGLGEGVCSGEHRGDEVSE